jgi:hypothetical protein
MRPMLDQLELPQVQEITALERRVLSEHKPPGMSGSLLQNLGRRPARLTLWGVATGPDAQSFIDELETKFREGNPLPFTADITADAELERVVIDDLRVQDLAGKPFRFAYVMTLREFIEPVEPEDVSPLDEAIGDDALGFVDELVDGLNLAPPFATGLERFIEPLSNLLARLQEFNHPNEST